MKLIKMIQWCYVTERPSFKMKCSEMKVVMFVLSIGEEIVSITMFPL